GSISKPATIWRQRARFLAVRWIASRASIPGLPESGVPEAFPERASYRDIVDQPRAAEAGRDQEADGAFLARGERAQRVGGARFQIVELKTGARDDRAALRDRIRHLGAAGDPAGAVGEHRMERRRDGALLRRQI